MHKQIHSTLAPLREKLTNHALYQSLRDERSLHIFMQTLRIGPLFVTI